MTASLRPRSKGSGNRTTHDTCARSRTRRFEQGVRPTLTDVTLVAVTSVAIRPTIDALKRCLIEASFCEVLLLCDQEPPDGVDPEINWRRIGRLESRADYSRFMLRELA